MTFITVLFVCFFIVIDDVVQSKGASRPCTLCAQCFVSGMVGMVFFVMHMGFSVMLLLYLTRDKRSVNVNHVTLNI